MLPAIAAAFVSGLQASVVNGPAAFASSSASTAFPVIPAPVTGGPKAAVPAAQIRAIDAGELITTTGTAGVCVEQDPTVRAPPGESVPTPLIRSTVSPQMSEYDSLSAPGCHW